MPSPRKRADCCWSSADCSKAGLAPAPRSRPASSSANDKPVLKASETIPADAVLQARAGASLCFARRRQACGRAGAIPDRHRGSRLPRRRRLDRRLHRGPARQRRQPGVRDRRRARAVAPFPARPSQDRFHGRDRYPRLEGKRLPARPDIVVIDVSFISLKVVLPVALSLAAAPMHLLALIKPQFEARAKTFQARHHPRRGGASGSLRRHLRIRGLARLHRHPGVSLLDHRRRRQRRILPRRAPWLNASPSIMSAISATASRLPTAKHLCALHARRRDGRGRRRARSSPTAGNWSRIEQASPERIEPFCPHFGSAAAARSSTGKPSATAPGNANSWSRRWRRRRIDCEVFPLIDAHGRAGGA